MPKRYGNAVILPLSRSHRKPAGRRAWPPGRRVPILGPVTSRSRRRPWAVLLGLLWAVAASGTGPARAQTATPPFGDPRELLARLSPAERVAQLLIAPLWVAAGSEAEGGPA